MTIVFCYNFSGLYLCFLVLVIVCVSLGFFVSDSNLDILKFNNTPMEFKRRVEISLAYKSLSLGTGEFYRTQHETIESY
jgi:hypothetical protein